MSNYNSIKATINANIKTNGNQEITGSVLNSVLNAMVNTLGADYMYAGVATPSINPSTPDQKVFYITSTQGTYTNFGGLVVNEGEVAILRYDSTWHKDVPGLATKEKVDQLEGLIDDVDEIVKTGYIPIEDLQQTRVNKLQFNTARTAFQSAGSNSLFVTYVPVTYGDVIRVKAKTTASVVFIYGFSTSIPAAGVSVTGGTRLEQENINFELEVTKTGYFAFYCVSSGFQSAVVSRLEESLFAPYKIESHILGVASFIGPGNNTIYSQFFKTFVPGHTYRFYLENWVKATSSSYHVFAVWAYDAEGTKTELFYVRGDDTLQSVYDVTMPNSGFVKIQISARISSGQVAKCHIMDVTSLKVVEQSLAGIEWKADSHFLAHASLTGIGNETISTKKFTGFIVGHTYRFYLINWIKGTSSSYHQFGIKGFDDQNVETTILSVRGDATLHEYYDVTIPDGVVAFQIYGRISSGVVAECHIEDITALVSGRPTHLNICILGNSYSADAWRYVPTMLLAYGITCKIEFYYRGSGSLWDLDDQWTNDSQYDIANEDNTTHIRLHFGVDSRKSPNWVSKTRKSAKDIIESGTWDIVVIQQRGNYCRLLSDYSPYLQNVIDKIMASCNYPFELWWFEAYNGVAQNPIEGRNQESLDAQKIIYKAYPFSQIIPAAAAVFGGQKDSVFAEIGDSTYKHLYSSDDSHLQEGLPCYLVACVVVQTILNKLYFPASVLGDQFRPTQENIADLGMDSTANGQSTGVTDDNCKKAQKEALIACRSPFDIQPPLAPDFVG